MKKSGNSSSRRKFIKQNVVLGAGSMLAMRAAGNAFASPMLNKRSTPAVLGGEPIHTSGWSEWPIWREGEDEKRVLEVLRSGTWSRAGVVTEFEKKWAETVGAKRCLTLVNGTNALMTSLIQLDIGGGDEVLLPPYTFISSASAILATGAIPIFVDVDPETFQIDPDKIETKITSRTRAIMPVHICGFPADMHRIMSIAKKHNLVVVEDACQAWKAEIDHKQVGTFGDAGCFSFQNSKNIPIGEGGAIVSNDEAFIDRCFSYHNFGIAHGSMVDTVGSSIVIPGNKLRMTEYQAAIGLSQLVRFEEQSQTRSSNAEYLRDKIKDLPGVEPYRLYDNVTRAAYHLFPFRYKKEEFQGLSRADFLTALRAEGVPCSSGYTTLNTMPFLKNAFESKNFKMMYPKEMLDYDKYMERNQCPENDRLCNEEAVWFTQNMLLGPKSDMDDIAMAIEKIHSNADKLRKTASK